MESAFENNFEIEHKFTYTFLAYQRTGSKHVILYTPGLEITNISSELCGLPGKNYGTFENDFEIKRNHINIPGIPKHILKYNIRYTH